MTNMIRNIIIALIIFFLVMTIAKFIQTKNMLSNENFANDLLYNQTFSRNGRTGEINASPYTSVAEHVRLDRYKRIQGLTVRPPLPKEGEIDCIQCTCPNYLPSTVTCWKCS